jgi:hypothetical protein
MLVISFVMLVGINTLQRWSTRREGRDAPESLQLTPALALDG